MAINCSTAANWRRLKERLVQAGKPLLRDVTIEACERAKSTENIAQIKRADRTTEC